MRVPASFKSVDGQEPVPGPKTRKRKAWKPDANDHLVYQWVRFEGKRQWWVANQLRVSQATVSRTLRRYEKWQSHAEPGADGGLDHAERLRAQRWLTYERNELILASCLRIAGDVEGFTEVSKSVLSRPLSSPSAERELRSENKVIDRSGIASRYLRLAFRINMEQLKLTEQEPLEALPPLTEEENAACEAESAAVRAEMEAAPGGWDEHEVMRQQFNAEVAAAVEEEVGRRRRAAESTPEKEEATDETRMDTDGREGCLASASMEADKIEDGDEGVGSDETRLHKVHNCIEAESDISADQPCGCDESSGAEKTAGDACISQPRRRRRRDIKGDRLARLALRQEARSLPPVPAETTEVEHGDNRGVESS